MTIVGALLAELAGFCVGAASLRRHHHPFGLPERATLFVLATLFATVSVLVPGSPTGHVAVDALARAVLGGASVLLAARAQLIAVLVSSVLAVVATFGSGWQILAGAAVGLMLADAVSGSRSPLLAALAGGAVAQVAMHLQHPAGRGETALVAAVILLPIVVSGVVRLPRSVRRRVLGVAAVLACVALVASVGSLVAAMGARSSLDRGISLLTSAAVSPGGSANPDEASVKLVAAVKEFGRARAALGNPLVRSVTLVPIAAQQWRALHAAAITGVELSQVGLRVTRAPETRALSLQGGQVPLDKLAQLSPLLHDLAQRLEAGSHRLRAAQSPWLLSELDRRVRKEAERLVPAQRTARSAADAVPQLPAIMGAQGTRRYFLAVQTPAEERATGGFMGNFGEITADQGRLSLTRFGRIDDLVPPDGKPPPTLVASPEYMARYGRFHTIPDWRNVNVSPDFPTVADVIASLYPQTGGQPVDGVIAIDPAGLAEMLKLVGPVSVPLWPEPLTADNAARILLREQYRRILERSERADFLGTVAQEVWTRLTTQPLVSVQTLLAVVGPAVREKHLMVTGVREREEDLYDRLGATGRVAPLAGDFLGVITQNAGGSKLDAYLSRTVDYRVEVSPSDGRLQGRLRVTLRNDAPVAELPSSVLGTDYFPDLPLGANKLYLSVYTPWALEWATVDGHRVTLEADSELGRRVYSGALIVPAGGAVSVEMALSGRLSDRRHYRLDLHRQPVASPDSVSVGLRLPDGWAVSGSGSSWSDQFDLSTDRSMSLALQRR